MGKKLSMKGWLFISPALILLAVFWYIRSYIRFTCLLHPQRHHQFFCGIKITFD